MIRVLTLSTLFPDSSRPGFGGFVERQTLALAAHAGVECRVVAPLGLPAAGWARRQRRYHELDMLPRWETWKGLDVYRPRFATLPVVGGPVHPLSLWWALLSLLDAIRAEFPFDVIDTEFFYPDGPAAVALGRRYGVPVSIKARGSDIHLWGRKRLCRAMIVAAGRSADGMLAVSGALRDDMVALGLPADRIRVHPTGLDRSVFHPRDRVAAKAGLGVAGPLVVSIGNLIALKGHALVVEAMGALPGVSLLIAGEGPERIALEQRIAALGLTNRVRLLGSVPHDQLPALLSAADVMALPSASEGLANVWVESLACGTPIVITDVGGARDVVNRTAAGRLVERCAPAIADGIKQVLATPRLQLDVAEAVAGFSWERNCADLYDYLRQLVGTRRGDARSERQ